MHRPDDSAFQQTASGKGEMGISNLLVNGPLGTLLEQIINQALKITREYVFIHGCNIHIAIYIHTHIFIHMFLHVCTVPEVSGET